MKVAQLLLDKGADVDAADTVLLQLLGSVAVAADTENMFCRLAMHAADTVLLQLLGRVSVAVADEMRDVHIRVVDQ